MKEVVFGSKCETRFNTVFFTPLNVIQKKHVHLQPRIFMIKKYKQ